MRRGGQWSWKWYAINAVGWFSTLWLFINVGNFYKVEFFTHLANYGSYGYGGMAFASLVLAPGSYFLVKVVNGSIHRTLENLARDEQKLSKNCRLIHDKRKFDEHQERLVAEATEVLFATGSRSRNAQYLSRIEKRLTEIATLSYTRVLFGPIKRDELRTHCATLAANKALSNRVRICEISDLTNHTEAFMVVNEHEALIVVPSINAIGNVDTGLLMTGPLHRQIRGIVESYTRAATPWKS